MLRELSVQMAFRSLTVQELLEQLCREPAYAAFQFPVLVLSGLEQGMPLADAWESGIRQDKAIPETGKNLLLPWAKNWAQATWTVRPPRCPNTAGSWNPMPQRQANYAAGNNGPIAAWVFWAAFWRQSCFAERKNHGNRSHF